MISVGWIAVVRCRGDAEIVGVVVTEDGGREERICTGEFEVETLAWCGGCGYKGGCKKGRSQERNDWPHCGINVH